MTYRKKLWFDECFRDQKIGLDRSYRLLFLHPSVVSILEHVGRLKGEIIPGLKILPEANVVPAPIIETVPPRGIVPTGAAAVRVGVTALIRPRP
jgi:hypothetical protein